MELISPSEKYKESFISAVKEYQAETPLNSRHEYYRALDIHDLKDNFDSYLKKISDAAKGVGLPAGYVPQSDFWLVDNGQYIGRISIRHTLTDHLLNIGGHIGYDIRSSKRQKGYGTKILALALPRAKELGLDKVLLTCDEINIPSRKIIEANGGLFEDKRRIPMEAPTNSGIGLR
jgi:predicted acetyltransferase